MWTEVVWLWAGTSGGPWWNTVMIIHIPKNLENYWHAEWLSDSQAELCSRDLLMVKHILFMLKIVPIQNRKQVNNNSTIKYIFCKVMETKCSFLYKNNFVITFSPFNGNVIPHSTVWTRHPKKWKPILFLIWGRNRKQFMHNILLHSFWKQYSHLKLMRHQQWFTLPDNTTPLCRTSSIFWTIILCTSCNSVLRAERLRRARESVNTFLAFWMYVSEKLYTY